MRENNNLNNDPPPPLFAQQKNSAERDMSVNQFLFSQKLPEKSTFSEPPKVTHRVGQIQYIQLPAGWTAGYGLSNVVANSTYEEFVAPSTSSASPPRIEFFYRGTKVPENEARVFQHILSSGHVLPREEFLALGSILRGKDRDSRFSVDLAWIARHNGQSVLMIEGSFLEDGMKTLVMLIDAGDNGAVVQEVAFVASDNEYKEIKPQVERALQSIKWR